MTIHDILSENNIPFQEYGKNWGKGWIMINCPFCDDSGFHGGIHLSQHYYNCWRCGWRSLFVLFQELTNLDDLSIRKILDSLGTSKNTFQPIKNYAPKVQLPEECHELQGRHKEYLTKRNFNPDRIKEQWDIKGTGHIGSYKFRIMIPIYFERKLISYMGRDITDKQDLRYKACLEEKEVRHYKTILYGLDQVPGNSCIIVEGITDVWRLGYGAIATFGTGWMKAQAMLVAERFSKVFILFDAEVPAQEKAQKLGVYLTALGTDVEILELSEGDPGELSDLEASNLMKIIK